MKLGERTEEPGLYKTPEGFALSCKGTCERITVWKRKALPGYSKTEALIALRQLRVEATEAALTLARKENPTKTLSVFARRWVADLQRRHEAGEVTFKTVDNHLRNLERFVLPMLGRIDVDALKPRHVRDWMRWVTTLKTLDARRGRGKCKYSQAVKPYARATLASAWRSLRAFTAWLTTEADLVRNPAREVRWDVRAPHGKQKDTLTADEVKALLAVTASEEHRPLRLMIVVALVGAMRASELSALTWEDLDLDSGTISIRRSHVAGHIGDPKTDCSRRVVLLTDELVAELRFLEFSQLGPDVESGRSLFTTATGKRHTPSSINSLLLATAKLAGVAKHVTSHVLRRTTNNLLRQTAGEIVARKVTGHVTQAMTAHYSDVDRRERVSALRAAFGSALDFPT